MAQTPILLIHGFPVDHTMWKQQAEGLNAAGFHVITPDLPGFGGTPAWERDQYTINKLADFIADFIRALPEKKAVVGGFSMGGYIALALAREYPELLAGLMLIDTRPDPDSEEAAANRVKAIANVESGGLAALAEAMVPKLLSKNAPDGLKDSLKSLIQRQSVDAVQGAQQAMLKRRDQRDLLTALKVPVFILVGDSDTITSRSVALSMHNLMPQAMLIQISKAGHLAPMEQPEAVTDAMKTFLVVSA